MTPKELIQQELEFNKCYAFCEFNSSEIVSREIHAERNLSIYPFKGNIPCKTGEPYLARVQKDLLETDFTNEYLGDKSIFGPCSSGTVNFKKFISSGRLFKWCIPIRRPDTIIITSPYFNHRLASNFGAIYSAGCGQLIKTSNRLWLNNNSTHYKPSIESILAFEYLWNINGYLIDHIRSTNNLCMKIPRPDRYQTKIYCFLNQTLND